MPGVSRAPFLDLTGQGCHVLSGSPLKPPWPLESSSLDYGLAFPITLHLIPKCLSVLRIFMLVPFFISRKIKME